MSDEERERDSAPPDEVVVEAEDDGAEDWNPFDEVQDDFKPRPIIKITAADGMPTNFAPVVESDIPELSPQTLVCMGMFDSFVLRGQFGDVLASFQPSEVERSPYGHWRVPMPLACERLKLAMNRLREFVEKHCEQHHDGECVPQDDTVFMRGMLQSLGYNVSPLWVEVEPVRRPCRHYARQLTQFELNAQAKVMLRVCSARRTSEGAFMTLRDRAMWGCDMRNPPVPEAWKPLDQLDEEKMAQGRSRELLPIFSTDNIFGGASNGQAE
jgi:hypothetical protein